MTKALALLYFLSFILLYGLLFSNLVMGVVINALNVVNDTEQKCGEEVRVACCHTGD